MLLAIDPPRICIKCGGCKFYVTGKRSLKQCRDCHLEYNRKVRTAKRKDLRRADPVLALLSEARARAARRGLPFELSRDDLEIPEVCPLLGIPLIVGVGILHPGSPSLDRVIPVLGYVPGNVLVISHLANSMKNAANPEQLRLFAKKTSERI